MNVWISSLVSPGLSTIAPGSSMAMPPFDISCSWAPLGRLVSQDKLRRQGAYNEGMDSKYAPKRSVAEEFATRCQAVLVDAERGLVYFVAQKGEKDGGNGTSGSGSGHWWMDYWQGDDYSELDQTRHNKVGTTGGGSVYAFADGSARYMRFGETLTPVNMWFVDENLRKLGASF